MKEDEQVSLNLGVYFLSEHGDDSSFIVHSSGLSPILYTSMTVESLEDITSCEVWDKLRELESKFPNLTKGSTLKIPMSQSLVPAFNDNPRMCYQPVLFLLGEEYDRTDIIESLEDNERVKDYTISSTSTFIRGRGLGSDDVFFNTLLRDKEGVFDMHT